MIWYLFLGGCVGFLLSTVWYFVKGIILWAEEVSHIDTHTYKLVSILLLHYYFPYLSSSNVFVSGANATTATTTTTTDVRNVSPASRPCLQAHWPRPLLLQCALHRIWYQRARVARAKGKTSVAPRARARLVWCCVFFSFKSFE